MSVPILRISVCKWFSWDFRKAGTIKDINLTILSLVLNKADNLSHLVAAFVVCFSFQWLNRKKFVLRAI